MTEWLIDRLIDRLIDFLEHVTVWLAEEELTPQSKMLVTNLTENNNDNYNFSSDILKETWVLIYPTEIWV